MHKHYVITKIVRQKRRLRKKINEFSVASKKISIKDWIIYPTNKHLLRLNFLSCSLVFYDCFMVPFKNTFGSKIFKENERTLIIIDTMIKFVFSLDVFLGFRKAYLGNDGQMVKDPSSQNSQKVH